MAKFAVLLLVALAFGQQIAGLPYQGKYFGGLGPYGGKYSKDMGMNTFPYVAKYGYGLEGGKYGMTYGGMYGEFPKQWIVQVQAVANEFSSVFAREYYGAEQTPQVFAMYARHFTQIVDYILEQLEGEVSFGKDMVVEQVMFRLREIQKELHSIAGYSTFTGFSQLRFRFIKYVQEVAGQIAKLIAVAQQTPEVSNDVVKRIVQYFIYSLHNILYQYQGQYGVYGKGYEYGLSQYYPQQYGNGKYAPNGQDLFGKYAPFSQYAYGKYVPSSQYGYGSLFGLQGQTIGQLVSQIQYVVDHVFEQFETGTYHDQYLKQFVYTQAYQLMQVLDHMTYMLQGYEYTDSIYLEVVRHFKQIQIELHKTMTTEVTSFDEMKVQLVTYMKTIATELQKLGFVAQSDMHATFHVVIKKVLMQYLAYLRYFYYQVQGYTKDYGFSFYYPMMATQFKTLGSGFSGLRDVTYNPSLANEYRQYVQGVYNKLYPHLYNMEGEDYVVPQQVLHRFKQILDIFPMDSEYGATNWYGRLGDNVMGLADELQNWIAYEPKFKGSYYHDILPVDLLGDFMYATNTYHDAMRGY